jgi:hypothetical protein
VTGLAVGSGCAAGRPLAAWQDSLTTYIAREGHGDPHVLRETPQLRSTNSLRPATIRFSKLDVRGAGLPPFVERRDVHGVMLDRKEGRSSDHYAFLVGVVNRPFSGGSHLADMRLAVFQMHGNDIRWRVSRPDPEALERYLAAVSADRALPRHGQHQTFPADDDVFHLSVDAQSVVARDERSGATWRVDLRERHLLSTR